MLILPQGVICTTSENDMVVILDLANTETPPATATAADGDGNSSGRERGSSSSSSEELVSEPLIWSTQARLDASRALLRCCWGAVFPVLSPSPRLVCSDRGAMRQVEDMEGDPW
jgi:hypothetical protein